MKFGAFSSEDVIQRDGLTDPLLQIPMGKRRRPSPRRSRSARGAGPVCAGEPSKASVASRAGYFADEIVPVTVSAKRGVSTVREDEPIRHDLSAGQLAALKPAFRADGSVTAGNALAERWRRVGDPRFGARRCRYGLQPLAGRSSPLAKAASIRPDGARPTAGDSVRPAPRWFSAQRYGPAGD